MLELAPYRALIIERLARPPREGRKEARTLSSDLSVYESITDGLDERDKLTSAKLARFYVRGLVFVAHGRWKEALANASEGLKLDPSAEPFLWQRAVAYQNLGQFNRCIAQAGDRWTFYDHRRELLAIECSFLEGRYTDAAKLAVEYRRKYPFDISGAFWQALAAIRVRRPFDEQLREIESFWGDRPMVRALKIFYFSYMGKLIEAKAMTEFETDIPYRPEEWAVLEFAHAWFLDTYRDAFSEIRGSDRGAKLLEYAYQKWPLARLMRHNLPRDAVQAR
jgi:hypothetical protein